jgi:hypothetical protein
VGVHWRSETLFYGDDLLKPRANGNAGTKFVLVFMRSLYEGHEINAEGRVRKSRLSAFHFTNCEAAN